MADINRTRTKTVPCGIAGQTVTNVVTEKMQDYYKKPKPLIKGWNQLQVSKSSPVFIKPDIGPAKWRSGAENIDFLTTYASFKIPNLLSYAQIEFDFTKNNTFEILPFIWELDETLATFSIDFIKNFSYGAYNWGLNPLLQDLKGIHSSLKDLFGGIDLEKSMLDFCKYPKSFNINPPYPLTMPNFGTGSWFECKMLSGDFKLVTWGNIQTALPNEQAQLTALNIFLDEIGFHPDLASVWSVIPLSFVLDYFLPVGEYLERLHPRGWFNPTFSVGGPFCIKGSNLSLKMRENVYSKWYTYPQVKGSYIYRSKANEKAVVTGLQPPIKYKCPSLRQLFNANYIANSIFNTSTKKPNN